MEWESRLRELYPAPDIDGIQSYYFALDGGGRDLIVDMIRARRPRIMLEIGCYLCGSTRLWLDADPDLKVIGVDPWDGPFALGLLIYLEDPVMKPCFKSISDPHQFIASVGKHGPFASALANVRHHGDRFIPVKDMSPQVLPRLHELGVRPDVIYIDSDKTLDDLGVCQELFPGAVLCGDDWTWHGPEFPVRKAVNAFCEQHGYTIKARGATWLIAK